MQAGMTSNRCLPRKRNAKANASKFASENGHSLPGNVEEKVALWDMWIEAEENALPKAGLSLADQKSADRDSDSDSDSDADDDAATIDPRTATIRDSNVWNSFVISSFFRPIRASKIPDEVERQQYLESCKTALLSVLPPKQLVASISET